MKVANGTRERRRVLPLVRLDPRGHARIRGECRTGIVERDAGPLREGMDLGLAANAAEGAMIGTWIRWRLSR
jgi:hypothetical protein